MLPISIVVFGFLGIGLALFAAQITHRNFGSFSATENVALVAATICHLITVGLAGALIYRHLYC